MFNSRSLEGRNLQNQESEIHVFVNLKSVLKKLLIIICTLIPEVKQAETFSNL